VAEAPGSNPPIVLGDYRLEREIGVGGMGRVFQAVDVKLDRKVAVKVIRAGLVSKATAKRFIDESRTLAKFAHPGIAQIFAASHYQEPGAAEPIPYFVMEHVAGAVSITHYAKVRRLDADDRIRLFMRVCEAMEHAHRCRVIHRDLKPSNIIISEDATEPGEFHLPQPKVIDFGIARPLDHQVGMNPPVAMVGTLEYMSPEQCDGRPLDVRTDVYALGVVLYQLLAGSLPYPVLSCGTTQEAVNIIAKEAPKPLGDSNPRLKGDLDAIVQKALSKEPSNRYQSVSRLRADLDRYLCGEAVEARWNSLAYVATRKVRSWVGMHPRTSLSTLLLVSLLFVLLPVGMILLFRLENLSQFYGWVQTSLLGTPTLGDKPENTVLIGLTDETDVEELQAAADLAEPLDATFKYRHVYARLLDKLQSTRPRSVVFDIRLRNPSDSVSEAQREQRDTANHVLADAALRFTQRTLLPVIAVAPYDRNPGPADDGQPTLEVSDAMLTGGDMLAKHAFGNLYSPYVYVKRPGERALPGIVLLALAPVAPPKGHVEFYPVALADPPAASAIGRGLQSITSALSDTRGAEGVEALATSGSTVAGFGPQPMGSSITIMLSEACTIGDGTNFIPANPEAGIYFGDRVGLFYSEVPSQAYFEKGTIEITDCFRMSAEELARRVDGKVIVFANLRKDSGDAKWVGWVGDLDSDDPDAQPGGWVGTRFATRAEGAQIHVAAIESICRGVHIRPLASGGVIAATLAAALFGSILTWRLFKRPWLVGLIAAVGGVGMIAFSLMLFKYAQLMFNPFVPALGMLSSALFCWLILRVSRVARPARTASQRMTPPMQAASDGAAA